MTIPAVSRRLGAALVLTLASWIPAMAQDLAQDVSRADVARTDIAQTVSPNIVISQVYGGGGNAGSVYKNDFIELFNRGAAPVDMTGWSVQYASATGATWARTNISGVLNPGQYYLVQEAVGTGGTQNLPTPDATGTIAMSGTAGKVALVTNQVLLPCGANCHGDSSVRDFVGFGTTANDFEGPGPTPAPSNTNAVLRALSGCTDTDNNAADFAAALPTPRNTSSPSNSCGGPTAPTGVAAASPSSVPAGGTSLLTVAVTPGGNPTSTGLAVTADLTNIGGANPVPMFDDGTHGDATAGDLTFSLSVTVAANTPSGPRVLTFTITDAEARSSTTTTTINVQAVSRTIHEIQGALARSPYDAQLVTTRGIVTARKINGFFLQAPDAEADTDPATSEGVFVFTSAAPPAAAAVGNEVSVTGTVQEFIPSADPNSPPATEIAFSPSVSLLSTGNNLPAPIEMTPSPAIDGQPFEYLEGMRIHVNSLTVVAPTAGNVSEPNASSTSTGLFYGVLTGTPRPFREPGINILDPLPPGAPANIPRFDENPERIRVDSRAQEGQPTVEVSSGAVLTNITGVLDFGFRCYTIAPDAGTIADQVGAAVPVRPRAADEFTVAAFNLERFFDTDNDPNTSDPVLTAAALERRMQKASLAIRTVMRSPDILGVEEVENLGVLETLAARLNADSVAAGDPDPGYVARLVEGNDIGGIDVGALVRTQHVAIVAVEQVGLTATYINPSTGLPELLNDRPPLVVRAAVAVPGGPAFPIVVVVNHLRSLLGMDDPGPGGVRVRAKRAAQAEFLAELVDTLQDESPRAAVVTVGDFNAFEVNDGYVDVMGAIKGNPAPADQVVTHANDLIDPDLINLVETIPTTGGQRYSYVFDGNAQVLDHVLITAPLSEKARGIQYARNDADFPESLRNVATRPERLSDHDMPVAFFRYPAADLALAQTASTVVSGGTVTYTITATNGGPDAVAEQVTVTDTLPTPLTFDAVSATGWTCTTPPVGSGGTVSCARAEIATSAAVLVSARVACAVPNGTVITNSAAMTSSWDPAAGNNTAATTVTVSNPPPAFANVGANPPVITVPNRKWVDVTVNYDVTDNCDPAPPCALTVSSNDGAPHGRIDPIDWTIVDTHHVRVRATRNNNGQPRVYSIVIACTDSAGGVGTAATSVTVQ